MVAGLYNFRAMDRKLPKWNPGPGQFPCAAAKLIYANRSRWISGNKLARHVRRMSQDNLPFVPSQPIPLRYAIGKNQQDSSRLRLGSLALKVSSHIRVVDRSGLALMMAGAAGQPVLPKTTFIPCTSNNRRYSLICSSAEGWT